MKSDASIKHFTRGGQTLLHNFRMISQIMTRVFIFCFIGFVLLATILSYYFTSDYQQYLVWQWLVAKGLYALNEQSRQAFINPNGQTNMILSSQIINAHFIQLAVQQVSRAVLKAVSLALPTTIVSFVVIYYWLRGRGVAQSESKKLRGDEIVDTKTLAKLIKQSKNASDIKISDMPMPKNFEVRHVLVHGTIGSGKSVLIRQLLDQIRARGDRAIIYDKGCDFTRYYYREGKDVILNPLDDRTASWHLWDECRDFADYDSMAAALMPMPAGNSDPFWINAARTIFAASARQMKTQPDRSINKLLKMLLTADLQTMGTFLKGTEAETLVSEKIEKTAISIKSVLTTCLKSFRYVKDDQNAFSIRDWVMDDGADNWLFLSSLADRHETLKPLITVWLDIAVNAIMSMKPSQDRRIWVILDELPTLNRLPILINTLAESRKFGGCVLVGVQSIAQLREIYGSNGAESIAALCNSKFFFRSPSFDTAQWVSKELGHAELEEVREGLSYGESAMRSGMSISNQYANRQIVSPSEVMSLKDLEAYVRVPGGYPITQVSLKFRQQEQISEAILAREIVSSGFKELDKSMNTAVSQMSVSIHAPDQFVSEQESLEW